MKTNLPLLYKPMQYIHDLGQTEIALGYYEEQHSQQEGLEFKNDKID